MTIDRTPKLFDLDEAQPLIVQYEQDIADYGRTGWVRCAACGNRLMPTEHVIDRLNELRAIAFIHVDGDPADRHNEAALIDLAKYEARISRAMR